jgi:transcription antitermination protein NusB
VKRHELRERVLQAVYQVDVGKAEVDDAVVHVMEDDKTVTPTETSFVLRMARGVAIQMDEIDTLLTDHVQGWTLDRIARVDLNVLRLAVYELLHEPDVDIATIVDEAVELAKSFSTDESGKFVNGVLARLLPLVRERRESSQL